MDPAWPVLIIVAVGIAVACVLWFGERHVERARQSLEKANAIIQKIKGTLKSYVVTGNYIPENVRQPLDVEWFNSEIGAYRLLPGCFAASATPRFLER